MSAPPIGMMISTPNANAIASINQNGPHCCVAANHAPKTTIAIASARFTLCCPANATGALWNRRNL
jgi:hypothetical protein